MENYGIKLGKLGTLLSNSIPSDRKIHFFFDNYNEIEECEERLEALERGLLKKPQKKFMLRYVQLKIKEFNDATYQFRLGG